VKVTVSHTGGMNFAAATGKGARVMLSGADGDGSGPRPMEMVLMGLGGCSGIDVLAMLHKSRQVVTAFDIDIDAARADDAPAVFTHIHLRYQLRGPNLNRKAVARAVKLSMEKYCSVTVMLAKTAAVSFDVSVNGEKVDGGGDTVTNTVTDTVTDADTVTVTDTVTDADTVTNTTVASSP